MIWKGFGNRPRWSTAVRVPVIGISECGIHRIHSRISAACVIENVVITILCQRGITVPYTGNAVHDHIPFCIAAVSGLWNHIAHHQPGTVGFRTIYTGQSPVHPAFCFFTRCAVGACRSAQKSIRIIISLIHIAPYRFFQRDRCLRINAQFGLRLYPDIVGSICISVAVQRLMQALLTDTGRRAKPFCFNWQSTWELSNVIFKRISIWIVLRVTGMIS